MNQHERPLLSDAAIEAALLRRAAGHADGTFLGDIVDAASGTRQVRHWPWLDAIGRRPVVLASAAFTVLVVVASLAFSGGPNPSPTPSPAASLPAAVVGPSASPSPLVSPSAPPFPAVSPSDPTTPERSTETCATDTTAVLTGAAMPPPNTQPMTVPAGVLKIGVYTTADPGDGEYPEQVDVWAIKAGNATRIASIVGPRYNEAVIDDVSSDGQAAIIHIGEFHMASSGPECGDLYLVRTDGSGVVRLTHNESGRSSWSGAFSHDGQYVTFRTGPMARDAGLVTVPGIDAMDLHRGVTTRLVTCDDANEGSWLAWSPLDDRFAALCGAGLRVVTVDGSSGTVVGGVDTFDLPTLDDPLIGLGWLDPLRVLLVTAGSGATFDGPIHLNALTLGSRTAANVGTWSATKVSDPWLAPTSSTNTDVAIAPDGHAIAMFADPSGNDPQFDTLALYTIDPATGRAKRAADWTVSDPAWSADSRSLVFVADSGNTRILTVYDLASKRGRTYGSMPAEYSGGIWRGQ